VRANDTLIGHIYFCAPGVKGSFFVGCRAQKCDLALRPDDIRHNIRYETFLLMN
jgi:hypothetical protein